MYRTCLHCRASFDSNQSIEAFPIGHRLAFDAKRGRLWVVCRGCERWNLTPFDARWEAIEQAERAFRDTRVRVSTDHIGLARLRDGTELVRIGEPLRPEFAAWRYGDQFGKRRVRQALLTGGGIAAAGLAISGALAAAGTVLVLLPLVHLAAVSTIVANQTGGVNLPHPDGGRFTTFGHPRLVGHDGPDGWAVEVGYSEWYDTIDGHITSRVVIPPWANDKKQEIGRTIIAGAAAVPLLRATLPGINRAGAKPGVIREAVALIDEAGGSERFGRFAADHRRQWAARQAYGDNGDLGYIPAEARLAFEMAVFEDAERRAMDGELAALERAWAEAESVAVIADALEVSPKVEEALARIKRQQR